ncbi:MAG: response regulator transcription factor [Thermoleophilia bacterium]|nr:response regulator transcription factor [Thermoleophilia bacterium]
MICDDHALVRLGVEGFLEGFDDIEVVASAGSGPDAIALCEEHEPDVVLMDLVMPGMDGVEATRAMRQSCPGTRVLVLTSFPDRARITSALEAGAEGYLLKDAEPEDVADAVRRMAADPGAMEASEAA